VEIYLTLDHPHVARLLKVYEDEQEIHLVMEYMAGGELYDRLFQQRVYKEEMAAKTAKQMLLAVAYLHSHQIAHRDLKLENFLYERQDNDHLKLIDFGFAKFWDRSRNMTQACGSTHYVAPEVLGNSYTLKADLWSLGVISYMLLTGSPPFHGPDKEVLAKIRAGKVHWSSKFKRLSENAQDFVKALLVVNPNDRLDAQGALEHPWVKSLGTKNESPALDDDIKLSLRKFSKASAFRRAVLSMMAWSLNAEDRAQLRNEFLAFDTQNTGTITHLQMKEILEKYYHIDTMEAEAMFNSMDTDHDDVIAYSEFLAAALQGRIKVHEDVLRRTFRKFDVDNCGRITAEDLQGILGEHFEGTDAKELIKEADTNGDGMIEYDEFLNYFHRHEAHIDEELLPAAPSPSPWTERSRTKRRQHTENLSLVIDRLLSEDVPVTIPYVARPIRLTPGQPEGAASKHLPTGGRRNVVRLTQKSRFHRARPRAVPITHDKESNSETIAECWMLYQHLNCSSKTTWSLPEGQANSEISPHKWCSADKLLGTSVRWTPCRPYHGILRPAVH